MINKILNIIDLYLQGEYTENEGYPFYLELEKELLYDNFDEMYKENREITLMLNDNIPDICASASDIGIDEFKRLLEVEYLKIKEICND